MIISTNSKNEIEKKCKFFIIANLNRMNVMVFYFLSGRFWRNTVHCWAIKAKKYSLTD